MVIIHMEKNNILHDHKVHTLLNHNAVCNEVIEEFGSPLSIERGAKAHKYDYGDFIVYITQV